MNIRFCAYKFRWMGLFLLLANGAWAQPESILSEIGAFEGLIHYKFTVSGKDAAKIKAANDLEFMTLIIKEGNFIIHLSGMPTQPPRPFDPDNPDFKTRVMFPSSRIFLADSDHTYVVDAPSRRCFRSDGLNRTEDEAPTAVLIADSVKILNLTCKGYRVVKSNEEITYYIHPSIRVNLTYYRSLKNARANFLTKGLNGCIPLMTVRKSATYMTVTRATKIQPQQLLKEDFGIPDNFKFGGVDYRR